MKDKTILGAWCSEPNCIFIDHKHIRTQVMVHIWYSYDNDSKTDVLNKEISFVEEIDFDEFNNIVETPDEININLAYIDKEYLLDKEDVENKINEIINRHNILVDKVSNYLKSKGDE